MTKTKRKRERELEAGFAAERFRESCCNVACGVVQNWFDVPFPGHAREF